MNLFTALVRRGAEIALSIGAASLRKRATSPGVETGHIVLFECPMSGTPLSDTPPVTIRGARDAIERFIPLEEFDRLFGGFAVWHPPRKPITELPGEAIGVWSRRTCARFRRILRERGATLEVRREAGPEQRIRQLSYEKGRNTLTNRDRRRLFGPLRGNAQIIQAWKKD